MRFENIEIYNFEDEVWYRTTDGSHHKLDASDRSFIVPMIERIKEFYPEAYAKLSEKYNKCSFNLLHFQYKIVWMFCKCNFGVIDDIKDISRTGEFKFEHIQCPMRGECPFENIVCHPKFNSKISDAERRVLKMVYNNESKDAIADKLCISIHTVNNHIRNAYNRLGIHEKAEFIAYVDKHNLFRDEE